MTYRSSVLVAAALALAFTPPGVLAPRVAAQSVTPAGQLPFANTVTLAPTWFDPAETPG
jgi:hypothetical protein